jgi:lipopolysaccharide export system permease protein
VTIFARHMALKFLKPFLFGLGLFAVLIFLGDTFDKMNAIVKTRASLWEVFQCLLLAVPYWATRVIPMATLLATLVAMSGFVQSGEWLATQSCGFKTRSFWLPVLWCSLAVSVAAFAAQETVMPAAWARSRKLWHEKVHPQWEWTKYQNVVLVGGLDQFVQTWQFFPKEGRMERPTLEFVGPRGVERQLDAKEAVWDAAAGRWIFKDGVERDFRETGVVERPFAAKESDLVATPLELVPRAANPDELTWRQAREQARKVGRFGGSPREFEVAAHAKLAYPFTNFVICALGIPIALRLRRSSKVVSFCAALALSFVYLWTMEVGRALGVSGTLPAVVSAWLPNAGFSVLAAALIRRWDL